MSRKQTRKVTVNGRTFRSLEAYIAWAQAQQKRDMTTPKEVSNIHYPTKGVGFTYDQQPKKGLTTKRFAVR